MEDILIDTDVVIEYLRGKEKSSTELIKLLRRMKIGKQRNISVRYCRMGIFLYLKKW